MTLDLLMHIIITALANHTIVWFDGHSNVLGQYTSLDKSDLSDTCNINIMSKGTHRATQYYHRAVN